MDYEFKYQLSQAPSPRRDGSRYVDHDIWAVYREEGTSEPWVKVPNRHKTVSVFADTLLDLLATGTVGQKATAYKAALAASLNEQPVPVSGWTTEALAALMANNDASAAAATAANDFITGIPLTYPLEF